MKALWRYTEKKFVDFQMCFDQGEDAKNAIQANLDILAMIIKKCKVEDLSKRLLNEVFLKMEEMYLFNVELNMALLRKNILPLEEWDKAFA